MASRLVDVTNVSIKNNPSLCLTPFAIDVTFICNENIPEEIDWELIYIRDADEKKDITLDSFAMGPLEKGMMGF